MPFKGKSWLGPAGVLGVHLVGSAALGGLAWHAHAHLRKAETITVNVRNEARFALFSPDGSRLIVATPGAIQIHHTRSGALEKSIPFVETLDALLWRQLHRVSPRAQPPDQNLFSGQVLSMVLSEDGSELFVLTSYTWGETRFDGTHTLLLQINLAKGTVRIGEEVAPRAFRAQFPLGSLANRRDVPLVLAPGGTHLLLGHQGALHVLGRASLAVERVLDVGGDITSLSFAPRGDRLAVGGTMPWGTLWTWPGLEVQFPWTTAFPFHDRGARWPVGHGKPCLRFPLFLDDHRILCEFGVMDAHGGSLVYEVPAGWEPAHSCVVMSADRSRALFASGSALRVLALDRMEPVANLYLRRSQDWSSLDHPVYRHGSEYIIGGCLDPHGTTLTVPSMFEHVLWRLPERRREGAW